MAHFSGEPRMTRCAMPVGTGGKREVGLRGPGQRGFALLEVLIAGIVVGITILGVSLMLVRAPAFTVSEGTNQVELYLAEQKLERLRAVGLLGVDVGGPPTDPCSSDVDTCYYETLQGGAVTNGQPQSFKRLTCVDYVRDLPYPAVCTPNACDASVQTPDPDGTTPAGTTGCRTKRVQVKVQPLNQSEFAKADDPIALDMILVNQPQAVRLMSVDSPWSNYLLPWPWAWWSCSG